MLVLSRKTGESIQIGDDVRIFINRIAGNRITIAVDAPRSVKIVRGELAKEPEPVSVTIESPQSLTSAAGDEDFEEVLSGSGRKPVAVDLGYDVTTFVPRNAR